MNKKLEMSLDEWIVMTYRVSSWTDMYDEGDVIKVYHLNGRVFRYKIVVRKLAISI